MQQFQDSATWQTLRAIGYYARRQAREALGWRLLLALVLSVAIWAGLTLDRNPQRQEVFPSELTVEITGLPANLIVLNEVVPIRVRVNAPVESYRRLQAASFRASVDLRGADPGLHQFPVRVEVSDPQVEIIEALPSHVDVRLEELVMKRLPVQMRILNTPPFGYRYEDPILEPEDVRENGITIKGPRSLVERVTEVLASVQLGPETTTIDRIIRPEPLGPSGVVGGVTLEPETVTVRVPVHQLSGFKTVPIVPQVGGQPAPGYLLQGIELTPLAVEVVGDPDLLAGISVIPATVLDISGATEDITAETTLSLPTGVSLSYEQRIFVTVRIVPVQGQTAITAALAWIIPRPRPADQPATNDGGGHHQRPATPVAPTDRRRSGRDRECGRPRAGDSHGIGPPGHPRGNNGEPATASDSNAAYRAGTNTHPDAHGNPDTHRDLHSHADTDLDADPDTNLDTDLGADPDTNLDTDLGADQHANRYAHYHQHPDGHRDTADIHSITVRHASHSNAAAGYHTGRQPGTANTDTDGKRLVGGREGGPTPNPLPEEKGLKLAVQTAFPGGRGLKVAMRTACPEGKRLWVAAKIPLPWREGVGG